MLLIIVKVKFSFMDKVRRRIRFKVTFGNVMPNITIRF